MFYHYLKFITRDFGVVKNRFGEDTSLINASSGYQSQRQTVPVGISLDVDLEFALNQLVQSIGGAVCEITPTERGKI